MSVVIIEPQFLRLEVVPALDEVSGHVTSRETCDTETNVMPGHPGGGHPVSIVLVVQLRSEILLIEVKICI